MGWSPRDQRSRFGPARPGPAPRVSVSLPSGRGMATGGRHCGGCAGADSAAPAKPGGARKPNVLFGAFATAIAFVRHAPPERHFGWGLGRVGSVAVVGHTTQGAHPIQTEPARLWVAWSCAGVRVWVGIILEYSHPTRGAQLSVEQMI